MWMMNRTVARAAAHVSVVALAAVSVAHLQSQAAISLEPSAAADQAILPHAGGALPARDYRAFGQARVGQSSNRQTFTFTFH
jgi:methylmalonyl-CoA mutase cobalamin-binding subunit